MNEAFAIAILAAGQGTRFKSKKAKVLHEVGGRPLIAHVVRAAQALSPDAIFVIVGYQAEAVIESLHELAEPQPGKSLRFIRQAEPLGTGHALRCGHAALQSTAPRLLVLYGDTPLLTPLTLRQFLESHRRSGAAASVLTAQREDPSGYGRILRGPDGDVTAIVEQKSASPEQLRIPEINTGIYCFETALLWPELERLTPDPTTGEYYLTDVIGLLTSRGQKVAAYEAAHAAEVMGVNNRAEMAEVDAQLRAQKARELMLAGVTIIRPETVLIDPEVEVGADTVIEPGVSLLGRTRVGEDCRIGAFSVITDSEIADAVNVQPSCVIAGAKVASGAGIGPFARLRPGTEIGPEAKIGNFVEIKNTRVGRRARAGHLTYLGDATVGEGTNIGAGTITCNYDGEKKNLTVIEDDVFIGSGTELVAPVRVGQGAYVAAGSTITEDVPPDSLALARSRQITKPGWVSQRRKKAAKENSKPAL